MPRLKRRIEALQAGMRPAGLDAVVFADRENCIYYLGTPDIECLALVVPPEGDPTVCCLWQDAAALRAGTGLDSLLAYRFPEANLGATIVKAVRRLGKPAPRIGFHKYFVEFGIFTALREAFADMEFLPAMELTYRVRSVKDPEELALLETACSFLEPGMAAAVAAVRPGRTEAQVLAEAEYAMRRAGSEGSTFRMQVLTQARQLLPHARAGQNVLGDNEPVVVHLGASYRGYAAKMCRTVFLGEPAAESMRIHDVLRTAQERAVAALVPGRTAGDVFDAARSVIEEQGYGAFFLDHIGYGVGVRQSEFHPVIGKGLDHAIRADMVVALLLPTIAKPGVGGPRLTDMIHVTDRGGRFMTAYDRGIIRKAA